MPAPLQSAQWRRGTTKRSHTFTAWQSISQKRQRQMQSSTAGKRWRPVRHSRCGACTTRPPGVGRRTARGATPGSRSGASARSVRALRAKGALFWQASRLTRCSCAVLFSVCFFPPPSAAACLARQARDGAKPEQGPGIVRGRTAGAREPQPDADVVDVLCHRPLPEHPIGKGMDGAGGCGTYLPCSKCCVSLAKTNCAVVTFLRIDTHLDAVHCRRSGMWRRGCATLSTLTNVTNTWRASLSCSPSCHASWA